MNTNNNLTSLFAKWCNRSIGSTSGQTEQWPTSADQFPTYLDHSLWNLFTMQIGTNTAERKTTKRHICRSSSYWLSKLTTERLSFFVVKSFQNQNELQLFSVALANGYYLKQKNRKRIPGFQNTCTSEDLQAMKNTWHHWTKLRYRFREVHSQGEWRQTSKSQKRDQNLLSNSQLITKNDN